MSEVVTKIPPQLPMSVSASMHLLAGEDFGSSAMIGVDPTTGQAVRIPKARHPMFVARKAIRKGETIKLRINPNGMTEHIVDESQ